MNTQQMSAFLAQVGAAHAQEFMVVDAASSRIATDLKIPENIRFLRLPSHAPGLRSLTA